MKWFASIAILFLSTQLIAQDLELPEYAYDAFAEITLATTANDNCTGAMLNKSNLDTAMFAVVQQLATEGYDVTAAVQHLDTDAGKKQISAREVTLRERHGVGETGFDELCSAIKSEIKNNRSLRKMVKIR